MHLLTVLLTIFFPFSKATVIDGYCSRMSVSPGDSVTLFINASEVSNNYPLRLYDLNGNKVFEKKVNVFPQKVNSTEPWKDGYMYKRTVTIKLPNLKSGVYLWEDKIPIIIKASNPKIIVVYSSNTENAYCNSGGKSLYPYNSSNQISSPIISFLRPIGLPKHSEAFLRWFVNQPFQNVGYVSDQDLDYYNEINRAELILLVGHNEYWTLEARKNFDRFVNEGKNALIMSGNTMWWQVRYDKTRTKLICYRVGADDPIRSPKLKTVNWNDPTLNYSILQSIGVEFPLAGFGLKEDKGWDGFKVVNEKSPLLEGTNLAKGKIIPLKNDELDGTLVTGFNGMYTPVIDKHKLGFHQIEIVGYDSTFRLNRYGLATWIVFKKTKTSGTIINTASTDWCSERGMGNKVIQQITTTMIRKLLNKENVFSPVEEVKFLQ